MHRYFITDAAIERNKRIIADDEINRAVKAARDQASQAERDRLANEDFEKYAKVLEDWKE